MHVFKRFMCAAGLSALGACNATIQQLNNRAAFELSCPSEQIRTTRLDARTMGVEGCGTKAVYIESCEGEGWARTCTWVLNSREP